MIWLRWLNWLDDSKSKGSLAPAAVAAQQAETDRRTTVEQERRETIQLSLRCSIRPDPGVFVGEEGREGIRVGAGRSRRQIKREGDTQDEPPFVALHARSKRGGQLHTYNLYVKLYQGLHLGQGPAFLWNP